MNDEMPVKSILDQLLPPLFRAICRRPNDLQISIRHAGHFSRVLVRPHEDDFSLVIGANAKTFHSFRWLCQAIERQHDHRIILEKLQGGREKVEQRLRQPVTVNPEFDPQPLIQLLRQTLGSFSSEFNISDECSDGHWRVVVQDHGPTGAANALEMESALTTLFGAAAKLQGGDLRVVYFQSDATAPATEQPQTAAGRFTGEVQ